MAHALTPSPADPAASSVIVADGGDPRNAASVSSPMQVLLNGLAWLRGVLGGTISFSPTIAGDLSVASLSASGISNLNGNVNSFGVGTFGAGLSTGGNVNASGYISGRLLHPIVIGPNADASISPSSSNIYFCPISGTGELTGNRTWTISNAGLVDGDWLVIANRSPTYSVTVTHNDGSGTGTSLAPSKIAHLVFLGGKWKQLSLQAAND